MKEYSVDIEARVERWPQDGDEADAMGALLEELPLLGAMGAVVHGRLPEVVGARFHVAAAEPEEAVPGALRIFRTAAERAGFILREVEWLEAVTDERLQRELERPIEQDPYLGVTEVARLLGVSRQRVSELRGRPGFPEPVAELASGPIWRGWQLRRFLEEWPRRPGRPRADEELAAACRTLPLEALGRLAPREREVVELVRVGRPIERVAEDLGLKRATVRAYLRRGIQRGSSRTL